MYTVSFRKTEIITYNIFSVYKSYNEKNFGTFMKDWKAKKSSNLKLHQIIRGRNESASFKGKGNIHIPWSVWYFSTNYRQISVVYKFLLFRNN